VKGSKDEIVAVDERTTEEVAR